MAFQQIELTPALRPQLLPGETLLFVQDAIGLYEGRHKVPNYQNGTAYLTSHRACYVDNEQPRKNAVAVELKDVKSYEFWAGFLKSSAKLTLHLHSKSPLILSNSNSAFEASLSSTPSQTPPRTSTPLPIAQNRQWVCPICSFTNPAPSNFGPGSAVPPCLTCGVKPSASVISDALKGPVSVSTGTSPRTSIADFADRSTSLGLVLDDLKSSTAKSKNPGFHCPRCTYINHPALLNCEICGERLVSDDVPVGSLIDNIPVRVDSPVPTLSGKILPGETIDSVKFSFRNGGSQVFHEKFQGAMVQRLWLLEQAPSAPTISSDMGNLMLNNRASTPDIQEAPKERAVGIRGLERQGKNMRMNNQMALAGAFEDLEALESRAKEIIALAQSFATQLPTNPSLQNADTTNAINDSFTALSFDSASNFSVTRDHMSSTSSLYHTELARSLADFLADDKRAVLKREGGVVTLVDLWAIYNRARGIELISPSDLQKATDLFESLKLPVRLRRFKSGLMVVQEKNRTEEAIVRQIMAWVKSVDLKALEEERAAWGKGVTAREAADKFGWSIGVAREELEMAEDRGALCREVGVEGIRFWENFIGGHKHM